MVSNKSLFTLLLAATPLVAAAHDTDETHPQAAYTDLDYETPGYTLRVNSSNPVV